MSSRVIHADSRQALAEMAPACVDAVVCDPPYELSFMGRKWDATGIAFDPEFWGAVLRVLKPGGHLLAFGGSRTYHRMACAIEDAGFEVRDSLHWTYLSGFPKSLDVSKAIDAAAGVEREVVGPDPRWAERYPNGPKGNTGKGGAFDGRGFGQRDELIMATAPATDAGRTWSGWGTALKPSHEPIVLARRPLEGTVAANVLRWGTGGINVDGCRVGMEGGTRKRDAQKRDSVSTYGNGLNGGGVEQIAAGRWPPNTLLSHGWDCGEECAEGCPVAELDQQAGDEDGASRMFPCFDFNHERTEPPFRYFAKPSRAEREAGCDHLPAVSGAAAVDREEGSPGAQSPRAGAGRVAEEIRNVHTTVKSIALMRWLCRLVTRPGGTVLDPFLGSGTTGCAAALERFDFIGIEREAEYVAIAEARIAYWARQSPIVEKPTKADGPLPGQLGLFG